jgi:predicted secreted hydrolase
VPAQGFALDLQLARTQPLLLQGAAGYSRKGPDERQASPYYSEVQLAARSGNASGRAWLDHEWSDEILHPQAVGWDWLGMNLFDGSALTAFVLRRRDGTALWAGGSFRSAGQLSRTFQPSEVQFQPGRLWTSPGTRARYPVEWQLATPAGAHRVRALADAQELDSRNSTGTVYWEGLSELLGGQGRRVGLGYLEMTGYAAPLKLR